MKKRSSKKLIIIGSLASLVFAGGLLGADYVKAQGDRNCTSMVEKIAQKFNLNKDEVQKVFDEERTERITERHASFEENLSKSVEEGKISEEQKQLILKKMEELRAEREKFIELTREERREKMQETRSNMESFLEENGIDESVLRHGGMGHGKRGHFGGRFN